MASATPANSSVSDISPEDWTRALNILHTQLERTGGCVSSLAYRKRLVEGGISDAHKIIALLRLVNEEELDGLAKPDFEVFPHGRSFLNRERWENAREATEREADQAGEAVDDESVAVEELEEEPAPAKKQHRQEEARLCRYVKEALTKIYACDFGPDREYVFDVHNERPGSDFENVDLIAIDWRSDDFVEIVAVEVKLDFTNKLVQQAYNYARFSPRVWIAVPVLSRTEPAVELRGRDPLLFEHVVRTGMGILACRRSLGRSYEVTPIHWPRRLRVDECEQAAFIERYRRLFEEAGVVRPRLDMMQIPRL